MKKVLFIAAATFAFAGLPAAAASPPSGGIVNGRIAFTITAPGSDLTNIATVAADGSDMRVLAPSTTIASEAAEWVPGTDRLMFDSNRVGNVHLFTMDGYGHDVRQVTSGDGFEGYPSLSPDGSTIALDVGTTTTDLGIELLDADGSNPRAVTDPPPATAVDAQPAFSPDGTRIAFVQILDGTPGRARSAIFVVDTDGSDLRQLTDWAMNASYPNWSPDGTHILFNDNSNNGSAAKPLDLWVMDADGEAQTRLTHSTGEDWAFGADWSPDGTKIVYVAASEVHSLAVMDADGAHRAVLWTDRTGGHLDDADWGPRP